MASCLEGENAFQAVEPATTLQTKKECRTTSTFPDIPPQFVLSVEDTEKKVNLHIRQEETEKAAKMTGADRSVQRHVAKIEGWGSPRAQTSEAASSSKDIPKVFRGKFEPPPPIRLPDVPGYASSRMPQTPPPKAEAPKAKVEAPKAPSPRTEAQKAKSPKPTTPKAESPRPAVPKAKADSPKAVAKATNYWGASAEEGGP